MSDEPVVVEVLTAPDWATLSALVDEHADDLLTDAAAGRLSVIRHAYAGQRSFQERVDAIRLVLAEGRDDRMTGRTRRLSQLFSGMFGNGAIHGQPVLPAPRDGAPADPDVAIVGDVTLAFMLARTWTERRQIVAGFPSLFATGDVENTIAHLAGAELESYGCMIEAAREARLARGDRLFANAESECLMRAFAEYQPPLLTLSEARNLALIEFAETRWEYRRELLETRGDLLLSDEVLEIVDLMRTRYPADDERARQYEVVRQVLVRARREGVPKALAPPLPPTHVHVRPPDLVGAAAADQRALVANARRALAWTDPGTAPWMRAGLEVVLAGALINAPDAGLRAVSIEEALLRCQDALSTYTAPLAPEEWRNARAALGSIYLHRSRGDPSANREASIHHLRTALHAARDAGLRSEVVRLGGQLSLAYRERTEGASTQNRELAYGYAAKALELLPPGDDSGPWLEYLLGTALLGLPRGDEGNNVEDAIAHLKRAVSGSRDSDPPTWRGAMQALGGAYMERRQGEPSENLAHAVSHITAAQAAARADEQEWDVAALEYQLGAAHFRLQPDDPDARRTALRHFDAALGVFAPNLFPSDCRRTLRARSAVLFRERRWEEALEGLDAVVAIGDYLEGEAYSRAGRFAEIAEMPDVHARRAYCLLQLGRPSAALDAVDDGQARVLADALPEFADTELVPSALTEEVRVAGERLRALTWSDDEDTRAGLREARERFLAARHSIRQRLGSRPRRELRALVPEGGAVVVPLFTSQGAALFVATGESGEIESGDVVPLEDVTDGALRALLDPTPGQEGWLRTYATWLQAYETLAVGDGEDAAAEYDRAFDAWADEIDRVTRELWDVLGGPLHKALQDRGVERGGRVVVIPSKWLSLMPIHAAWRLADGRRRYLVDEFALTYAPSRAALAVARDRYAKRASLPRSLLAVVNPTGDLLHGDDEQRVLRGVFPDAVILGADGTARRVVESLPGSTHLHFSCHGSFSWEDPFASGLTLADDTRLTIPDLARLSLESVRVVALSACESGLTEVDRLPTEFLGLPSALLQAGAPAVVGSLWSVDEESTAMLFERFYERHVREKEDPPEALRAAQLALRQDERYAHPFYWAGFVAVGG
jgi:CHAT domain